MLTSDQIVVEVVAQHFHFVLQVHPIGNKTYDTCKCKRSIRRSRRRRRRRRGRGRRKEQEEGEEEEERYER